MTELKMIVTELGTMPAMARVRHTTAPDPSGCRWCGRDERGHGLSFTRGAGYHTWGMPTLAQRKARMRARTASRAAART